MNADQTRKEFLLIDLETGLMDGHYGLEAAARGSLAVLRKRHPGSNWTLVEVIDKPKGAFFDDRVFHANLNRENHRKAMTKPR